MIYSTYYKSPIGKITIASDGDNIVGLWNEGQRYYGGTINESMIENDGHYSLENAKEWLDMYFSGKKPMISDIPLAPDGSEFRKKVWDILCNIPYGHITTYGEIAKKMAEDTDKIKISSRAVGGAIGHNPISIIIPCHRVVGANGNLTGYAGGIDKKVKLLELEDVDMSSLFIPKKGTSV